MVDDNNDDSVLSPGEGAGLAIRVRNDGASHALGVAGVLTTTHPGVTLSNATDIQFGDVYRGNSSCGTITAVTSKGSCGLTKAGYPNITIATSIPPGTDILFKLQLRDVYGNTFSRDFTYKTLAIPQNFRATAIFVVGDNNNNSIMNSGENAGLAIRILNEGAARALDIVGTLSTTYPGVTITNGSILQFGDINAGYTACGPMPTANSKGSCGLSKSYYPVVTVSPSITAGTSIPFNLVLKDPYNNTFSVNLSLGVQ